MPGGNIASVICAPAPRISHRYARAVDAEHEDENRSRFSRGVYARYAAELGSASEGAVLLPQLVAQHA
jgi:hypothetical protein